jgi:hypothetical protein
VKQPNALRRALLTTCLLAASWCAQAAPSATPTLCVWDPIGKGGQLFDAARSFGLAMQAKGITLNLKAYTDEGVATEDFKVGQCDGLVATTIRTKAWVSTPAALDYGGAATVVKDNKVDIEASYDVIRKAGMALASPNAEKFMVEGRHEVAGILPAGALYVMVRDREIFKRGFAGARMPAFDNDKLQAYLIAKAGGVPVAANIRNFATMFNNGNVDVVFAPAVAYMPLELNKGVGSKGGISRFPLAFTTFQVLIERDKFPQGFGQTARQYWAGQFDTLVASARKAEAAIPASVWVDYEGDEGAKFVALQRDSRIEAGKAGYYDKAGLKLMKRVRCSVQPASPDCGNTAEIDW